MISRAGGNRPSPAPVNSSKVRLRRRMERGIAGMKGIMLRAAIILLGTMAYIGLGMALASAG
jgi:hypothetical protein